MRSRKKNSNYENLEDEEKIKKTLPSREADVDNID